MIARSMCRPSALKQNYSYEEFSEMELLQIMLGMVFTLVGCVFGLLIALNYKFDKLRRTVDEIKGR
jgi:predicted histidine transporter YuiF (NhaC family)